MKITNVRAVQPRSLLDPPDWRTSLGQILVAIDTDKGITGYGVGGGGKASLHVIETVLRDLLIDQNPFSIETHWEKMYAATLPFGRKGLAIMAMSGVDLALWDLRGKTEGVTVAALLSENIRKRVPAYKTVWNFIPEEILEENVTVKLHVSAKEEEDPLDSIVESIQQARTLLDDRFPMMIDAWMKWDVPFTEQIMQRLRELNIELDWMEEPLPPDDVKGYEQLSWQTDFPIAGGEHEFTARGFQELIERNLHQVLQPDVNWCGGMTELVKIYEMANKAGVRVCPHRGGELWGLHAICALDPNPLAESGRPWMTWVKGQPEIIKGMITLPEAPGFGVHIDEENLP